VKLTAASLSAQSAEAFDGSPDVTGELECYVRFVLSREGKTLVVADTKADAEGERAKMARFDFTSLPEGVGKGAKVKLTGIRFVRRQGREYQGKTYYDMVYSFAACEVLEAGAARSGGFGGKGGWQPRSPEERASIEAQATMHAAADITAAFYHGAVAAKVTGETMPALFERTFDFLWAKLQATKRAAAAQQPAQEPGRAKQPAGSAASPGGSQGGNSQKSAASNDGHPGAFPASLSAAGQETARKIGQLVVEMFGQQDAPAALRNLTAWVNGQGQERPGLDSVARIASERQAKAIMVQIGPLHHWWKTARATEQARLADITLKQGLTPEDRWREIKALEEGETEPANSPKEEIEVLSLFPVTPDDWTVFLQLARTASGTKSDAAALAAVEKAAQTLFGDRYGTDKAKYLTEEAMNAVIVKLREK